MALFSKRNIKYNPYGLTKDDIKGDLRGRAIPMGIIVRMLEEQELQGNKADVKVFQDCYNETRYCGGFDFTGAREGRNFWLDVLVGGNYDLFFEKYPKYERYNLD